MTTKAQSPSSLNDDVIAIADAILKSVPLETNRVLCTKSRTGPSFVITKYASFDELRRAKLRKDPHVALRRELEGLQEAPKPRDDFSVLSDAVIEGIVRYCDPVSFAVVQLGATCHRLRRLCLAYVGLEGVCIIPDMIAYARLGELDRLLRGSLTAYLSVPGRRARLRRISLINLKGLPAALAGIPGPLLDPVPALQLVFRLPYLSFLDLRGVRWARTAHSLPALQHFLEDLHLVGPNLQVLKLDAGLLRAWAGGWWRGHPFLHTLVVGARGGGGVASRPLALPADLFAMLRGGPDGGPARRWTLKIWEPLAPDAIAQLLLPDEPLVHLQVLAVNLRGNCAPAEPHGRSFSDAILIDAGHLRTAKAKRAISPGTEPAEAVLFPSLESVTLVEVEEYALVAVGVFARLLTSAPNLVNFSICNTTRAPASSGAKEKSKE